MLNYFIACIITVGFGAGAFGQEAWDIARTTIDGKQVSIEYGRPNLKGRTLSSMLKQLPPDRIWRAGAGPITILSTETDLNIRDTRIAAGSYSLYMYCPEKGDFALVVNAEIGQPPDVPLPKPSPDRKNRPYPHFMDYSTIVDKEVARIPLGRMPTKSEWQMLQYWFEPWDKGALLTIAWGGQAWFVLFMPPRPFI